MSESTQQHREAAAATVEAVPCAVITVSDTRTPETDKGGDLVVRRLEDAGHVVRSREIVPDDADRIAAAVDAGVADPEIRAVLTTGGTGISRRDTTIEVVRRRLASELPGFGELFRMLSWDEVGAAAMLSRAIAGLAVHDAGGDTFIFAMPGSTNAVDTAMSKLVTPELSHLVWERR
ncbi:MAG: MogA/MoaB family molybdenum cofactor biosynthesis protein [Phycisphaerales bacterium]